MFILKKGHQPGVYVPLRALFLVWISFGGLPKMRTKLWRDSLENEAVESLSFRVRFSGRGTLYVQIPGKWHIRDESRVPPGHLNLLCFVKIVFG